LQKIEPPKICPSCHEALEQVKDQLFCRNSLCGAQQYKKVEHFAKVLKIKGLGPMSIKKLNIRDINEIYELKEDVAAETIGEKLANKLMLEIENSKKASLNQLLPAFGISLVGNTASQKLCKVISNIYDISEASCKEAGLGPKATENVLDWYENEFLIYLKDLDFSFTSEETIEKEVRGTVCISGKLSSFKTKAEAQKVLEEAGYEVKSSVTKDVTILINESGLESTKTKKARESGITILTDLKEIIGN